MTRPRRGAPPRVESNTISKPFLRTFGLASESSGRVQLVDEGGDPPSAVLLQLAHIDLLARRVTATAGKEERRDAFSLYE